MPETPKTPPSKPPAQQSTVTRTVVTDADTMKRGLTGNPNPKGEPPLPKK